MKRYRHLFFDLDHTLWDFETNSRETLLDLFHSYDLEQFGCSFEQFYETFCGVNEEMWLAFGFGSIGKEKLRSDRFTAVFKKLNLSPDLVPENFSEEYINKGPRKKKLLPDTREVLEHLVKNYRLHILSNGFDDIQKIKLASSGIEHYFSNVITSESSGFRKPDKRIFYFALEKSGGNLENSIMIGDGFHTDILGAKGVGMDQVFFNPKRKSKAVACTFEISKLRNLLDIL